VRLLVDTHPLLWSVDNPSKLTVSAKIAMQDPSNERLLSAATVWELAIKLGQGKITLSMPYKQLMEKAIADLALDVLPITVDYADRQSTLPPHHKDPFDRLMIAQALVDGISIVSADTAFDAYGVTRIW
jgi:PIN domain nuclease of toxin-antitoxin system